MLCWDTEIWRSRGTAVVVIWSVMVGVVVLGVVARLPCILRAIVFASFTTCMVTLLEASALMIRVTSLLRGAKVISRALTALLYGGNTVLTAVSVVFALASRVFNAVSLIAALLGL